MNAFAFGDAQTQIGRKGEVCNYASKAQVFYLFDFFSLSGVLFTGWIS